MDIAKFCAEEDGRYQLSKPWVKDGWRYATDGRIAVREPTDEPDSEGKFYAVPGLFLEHPGIARGLKPVPTHDGTGTEWEEPACIAAENPPKACKLWGKCPATEEGECTNTVKGRTPSDQRFAGKKWGGKYIDLINGQLPGAVYAITRNGLMRFSYGDVEGVLAPMKDDKKGG